MNQLFRTPLMWLGLGVAWGLLPHVASAQTGIGTTTPDPSAMLEIRSVSKGLLIPQVALTSSNTAGPVTSPATGLLVYNTSSASVALPGGPGYYYNAGTPSAPNWLRFISTSTPTGLLFWGVNGNSGTDANSNFLGTIDAQDLSFHTNNNERMRLYVDGGLGIGDKTLSNLLVGFNGSRLVTGSNNAVLGITAGQALTGGADNTFIGQKAGSATQTDNRNTFVGSLAGVITNGGANNTFLGFNAGGNNLSGSSNVYLGSGATATGGSGDGNILIGAGASNTGSLSNATAIGAGAQVSQSSSIVLGNAANVGIGTPAPSSKLHVVGSAASLVRFEGLNVSNATQIVTVTSTGQLATTPLIGSAGDFIANSNSTNNQQINASFNISGTGTIGGNGVIGQRLGIGTGLNPPRESLDISGNALVSGNATLGGQLRAASARIDNLINSTNNPGPIVSDNQGNLLVGAFPAPANGTQFIVNGTGAQTGDFNITNTGRIGNGLTIGGGGLGVTGTTTLNGPLTVTNLATLSGGLTAPAATITGLTAGTATLNGLSQSASPSRLLVTDNLGVVSYVPSSALPSASDFIANNPAVQQAGANFNIGGNGTVGGALNVSGLATFNNGLISTVGTTNLGQVNAGVTNVSTLTTSGLATLNSAKVNNLTAGLVQSDGTGLLSTITPASQQAQNTFINNQTATPQGAGFNISGSGTLGTLTVNGLTQLNNANIGTAASNQNLTVNGNLTQPAGATSLNTLVVTSPSTAVRIQNLANGNSATQLVAADPSGNLVVQTALNSQAILNQTATSQAAGFNINGSGSIGNGLTLTGGNLAVNSGTTTLSGTTTIGTSSNNANLTVNGNATISSLTTVANSNTPPATFVVANASGQLSAVSNAFLTGGFIQNFTTLPPNSNRQVGNFAINGTGALGQLQVGNNVVPAGSSAIITGNTILQGNVAVGLVSSPNASTGLTVRGNVVPDQAANNTLLGDPSIGVTVLNPGGRIWSGLNVLNAAVGFPAGAAGASGDATSDRLTVNGNVLPAFTGISNLGSPSQSWSNLYITGMVNTSDARLKTNINNLGYGLNSVMAMRPVRYAWKKSPNQINQLGFLAQEMQKVVPEVVSVGTDANHTMGINYVELVPVLVKALQEQQAQLDAMRGRAEKAEASLQSFEARLRALEAGSTGAGATAQGQR